MVTESLVSLWVVGWGDSVGVVVVGCWLFGIGFGVSVCAGQVTMVGWVMSVGFMGWGSLRSG